VENNFNFHNVKLPTRLNSHFYRGNAQQQCCTAVIQKPFSTIPGKRGQGKLFFAKQHLLVLMKDEQLVK
jgi:hypothetical protein